MKKNKKEPQPLEPFNAGQVLNHLAEAIEIILERTMKYSYGDHHRLMEAIVRMSLAVRRKNPHPEAQQELTNLLNKYEKEYSWLHDRI
jgi:hypothetical protein